MGHKELLKLKKRLLKVEISRRNFLEKQLKEAQQKRKTKVILAAHSILRDMDQTIQSLQLEIIILSEKIRQKKTR